LWYTANRNGSGVWNGNCSPLTLRTTVEPLIARVADWVRDRAGRKFARRAGARGAGRARGDVRRPGSVRRRAKRSARM
jgi:hypothetical protein